MLIEFSVKNYLSFKEKATFSMVATSKKNKENNLLAVEKLRLLKSAAIYGANASGKSNLLKGLNTMRLLVLHSASELTAPGIRTRSLHRTFRIEPFKLSTATENEPCAFEIIFIHSGSRYRYGFEIFPDQRVNAEYLFEAKGKGKEGLMFYRSGKNYTFGRRFSSQAKGLKEKTKSTALFLTIANSFASETAGIVSGWFRALKYISGSHPSTSDLGRRIQRGKNFSAQIKSFLEVIDLNISDVRPTERSKEDRVFERIQIKTLHPKYDENGREAGTVEFDLDKNESRGTAKILAFSTYFLDSISTGTPLIIDELDSSLHPYLTRFILSLFNNAKNKKGGQIIFTTHDAALTDELRADQFWLTEKSQHGVSALFPVSDFNIRSKDLSNRKAYLEGRFGGVPILQLFDIDEQLTL